jgi:hypothetical protein
MDMVLTVTALLTATALTVTALLMALR